MLFGVEVTQIGECSNLMLAAAEASPGEETLQSGSAGVCGIGVI